MTKLRISDKRPVVITKAQLDRGLALLFDKQEARIVMPKALYDYAWTVWAKRQGRHLKQGERAARMALRPTLVKA